MISGNVSFYNETRGEAVYPTPTVGMLGLIDDIDKRCTISFKSEGDVVLLLGQGQASLAGSEYLEIMQGEVAGVPSIDIELEKRVQQCLLSATGEGLLKSAHDRSDGGLAVALAESCIAGGIGFEGELPIIDRLDTSLFGEGQSRAVVSVGSTDLSRFEQIATEQEASILKLGFTKGSSFVILEIIDLPVEELADAWQHGLEKAMG